MHKFHTLTGAFRWLHEHCSNSTCTVIIHGDPYEWVANDEGRMILKRQYASAFYMKGR